MPPSPLDKRGLVLILAPLDGDTHAMAHVLGRGAFSVCICEDVQALAEMVDADSGVMIVAEEGLTKPGEAQRLADALRSQPDWSDLPVILLAAHGASEDNAWALVRGLETVGNITILERPLRRSTLVNAVSVALRARRRQYELRNHKAELERRVVDRTAELEESLRQLHARERLAALGTLAVGLGHDIANLALPIRMRLEPLLTDCSTQQGRDDVEAIGTALNYLTNLSAGLRMMAMDPTREVASGSVEDLAIWWAQAFGVLRGVLPKHVTLLGDFRSGMGVNMPAHRLTQAVFNLVQNAGEALAGSRAGVVKLSADRIERPGFPAMIRLHISDNGPGMAPAVVRRCFEPYFSTKGRAIATGMGLGMVRGLVESAGGNVQVQSELGVGTIFVLTLPPIATQAHAKAGSPHQPMGTRTALLSVVDPRMRAISLMLLEGLGLTVCTSLDDSPTYGVCVLQDEPRSGVEALLRRFSAAHVVLLHSPDSPDAQAWREHPRVTSLPRFCSPSALRDALLAGVQDRFAATSSDKL